MDLHPVLEVRINDLDLHPALEARINDFLKTEFDKFLEKGLVFEYEILLHDARMVGVCESIKAHYHWLHFGDYSLNSLSTVTNVVITFPPSSTGGDTWAVASFTLSPSSGEAYLPTQSHIVPLNLMVSASRSISE